MKQFKSLIGIFAFTLLIFGAMPATASAQYGEILEGIFGSRNNRTNESYSRRSVEDAINRLQSRADDFCDALDDSLDNSRYNNRNREDRILSIAGDFERAVSRLDDRYDDRRNSRGNDNEIREVLRLGKQLDNFVSNQGRRLDRRVESEWSMIRRDLQTVANAYGYNFGYNNDRVNNRNRRNDDIYEDDQDYRRKRRNRDNDDRDDEYRRDRNRDRYPSENRGNRRNRNPFPF